MMIKWSNGEMMINGMVMWQNDGGMVTKWWWRHGWRRDDRWNGGEMMMDWIEWDGDEMMIECGYNACYVSCGDWCINNLIGPVATQRAAASIILKIKIINSHNLL